MVPPHSPRCAPQTSVPVDVMPGEFDPTNYTLPQQPLHHCMLPLASAYSTLQLVTNPYQADVDGVRWGPTCHRGRDSHRGQGGVGDKSHRARGCPSFPQNVGFWGRRGKTSVTSSSTAAWTTTWRSWSGRCGRDTSAPRRRTPWVRGGHRRAAPRRGLRGSERPVGGLQGRVPLLTSAPAACYPFYKSDPFILTECPHVYFCGSAPRFQSKVITGESRPRPRSQPQRGWCLTPACPRRGRGAAGPAGGRARLQHHADRLPGQPARPQLPAHQLLRLRGRGRCRGHGGRAVTARHGLCRRTEPQSCRGAGPAAAGRSHAALLPIQLGLFV